jgi:hypothetical protein
VLRVLVPKVLTVLRVLVPKVLTVLRVLVRKVLTVQRVLQVLQVPRGRAQRRTCR